MRQLIKLVKSSNKGPQMEPPAVLIISPQSIIKVPDLHPQFAGDAIEKSKALAQIYHRIAREEGCEFLDADFLISSSKIDGVHLDETSCTILGMAVFEKIQGMFNGSLLEDKVR